MMIASFRVWKEVPETEDEVQPQQEPPAVNITELNDEIRDMLGRDHFGGVLLFGENFVDAEQTLRLTADMQNANKSGGGLPLMFFVDQEGGNVSRIGYGTIGVGNVAAAAKCYETMVVIHPTDASAVLNYGMCLRRLGKKEMSNQVLKRAGELKNR
jgi:beta-N-acetylhexosaminidase